MASISTGGGDGHGKKSVDAEIPLIPFIDLLLCCVMFLLVTAVWNKLDALKQRVDQQVSAARTKSQGVLDDLQQRLHNMSEYNRLPAERTKELNAPFKELNDHLAQQKLIAVINDSLRYFEDQGYQKLLDRMFDLLAPKPETGQDTGGEKPQGVKEPRPEYVAAKQIRVPFDKPLLTTAEDVEAYLEALRNALLGQISDGKSIRV